MTAKQYQEQMLSGPLHSFYQEMSEERGMVVFQEDSAPSHHAKSTCEWLAENSVDSVLLTLTSLNLFGRISRTSLDLAYTLQ